MAPATPGLLTSRYCQVHSCTIYLLLCTVYRQVSLVNSLVRPLPFRFWGKAGYACACPFPIRGQVLSQQACRPVRCHQCNVLSGTARYMVLPAFLFPIHAKLGTPPLSLPYLGTSGQVYKFLQVKKTMIVVCRVCWYLVLPFLRPNAVFQLSVLEN